MGPRGRSFLTGAAILGAASLISKLLGAVYRIPYQNIVGDLGLAAYNKIYPLYSIILIIATAGFPLAISKIVAEQLITGDKAGARRVLNISIYVLSITGILSFALLFFGADFIAKLMGNSELSIVIKSVSFALLIVPLMAAIRGYYQGHQYMVPTASSQVVEQIVRVITILFLAYFFMEYGYGVYYAAAGATFGALTGGIFAFLVLLLYWKKTNRITDEIVLESGEKRIYQRESTFTVINKILYFSIPIALGSIFLPLLGLVDSFSVSNTLKLVLLKSEYLFGIYIKGQSLTDYTEYWFGIYSRGQALVQFGAFFAAALSIALVPSISEANIRNNSRLVIKRSDLALRLTLMISLPATVGLAILAEPINILLYKDSVGSMTIAIYSIVIVFSTLYVTSAAILQGLGRVMVPAKNLLIGIIIKIILNIVLVYYFSINGAVMATIGAYSVASTLNLLAIKRSIKIEYKLLDFFVKPVMATFIMGVVVYISKVLLIIFFNHYIVSERLLMLAVTLLTISLGVIVYSIGLLITGTLTKQDLEYIPRYGSKVIKIAEKINIFKS
ncbi:MAG: oligosaccharide flippase family protein [Vulcanibacillus sp.]